MQSAFGWKLLIEVTVALLAAAFVTLITVFRWFRKAGNVLDRSIGDFESLDFSEPERFGDVRDLLDHAWYPYGDAVFTQTGTLPRSKRIQCSIFRHHAMRHLYLEPAEFYRSFEDGPWKWEAQQRFAGKNLNCGTYFSLSPGGANAEAEYYGMDLSEHIMIELDVSLDAVLDLTHKQNCSDEFSAVVQNPELINDSVFMTSIIAELVAAQKGGNEITDAIGHRASADYDGILFFGARALTPELRKWAETERDERMGFSIIDLWFNETKQKLEMLNLVMFSGFTVVRRTKRFRLVGGEWIDNVWFNVPEEALDAVMQYGRSFQWSRRVALIGGVRLVAVSEKAAD